MVGRKQIDIKERYGMWTSIKEVEPIISFKHRSDTGKIREVKYRMVECRCDCGKIKVVNLYHLNKGKSKSCGCVITKNIVFINTTHKQTGTSLYKRWKSIKQRCNNPNHRYYKDYGGRGIDICEEWSNNFEAFYYWCIENGYKRKLQIDRRDNSKGYSPNNCRWISASDNCLNKRNTVYVEYGNERMTLSSFCKTMGLDYGKTRERVRGHGWSLEKVIKVEEAAKYKQYDDT